MSSFALLHGPNLKGGIYSCRMLKDLFPCYVYSPATGASKSIAQLAGYKGGYASFMLSLSSSGSAEWWTLKVDSSENCTLQVDSTGIDLLVYSDRVAAGVFSSIAGIGYVFFFLLHCLPPSASVHYILHDVFISLHPYPSILSPQGNWSVCQYCICHWKNHSQLCRRIAFFPDI